MTENKKAKTNRMKQFNSGYQHGRKQTLEEVLKVVRKKDYKLDIIDWLEQKLRETE
jgi:hypothetical protein